MNLENIYSVEVLRKKLNEATSGLQIDSFHNNYSEQYKLNSPYMLMYENFDFERNSFFIVMSSPGFTLRNSFPLDSTYVTNRSLHKHDYFEFMFVMEGCVKQKIENQIYYYQKGQCCLLNQKIRHLEIAEESTELVFLAISNDFFLKIIQTDIRFNENGQIIPNMNPIYELVLKTNQNKSTPGKQYWDFIPKDVPSALSNFEQLFGTLIFETCDRRPGFLQMIQGIFARTFSILLDPALYEHIIFSLPCDHEEYLFLRIQELMEQTHGRIVRQKISEQLHYSPDYLSKIVKKRTGMTLSEYGRSFTLKEAAHLLAHTNLSIADIMNQLGFTNRTYFYKIFKKQYGITPGDCRNNKLY